MLDPDVARAGALEDRARLIGAVERVADDGDEDLTARDLIFEPLRIVLFEEARATAKPTDERESDDDREGAERG